MRDVIEERRLRLTAQGSATLTSRPCALVQGAECGEGTRERNLTCVVHWSDWPDSPYPSETAEDEKCGDRVRKESEQELQQPCFVPCPGA